MDRDLEIEQLIGSLQECLVRADELGLGFVGVFICQAIETLKTDSHSSGVDVEAVKVERS